MKSQLPSGISLPCNNLKNLLKIHPRSLVVETRFHRRSVSTLALSLNALAVFIRFLLFLTILAYLILSFYKINKTGDNSLPFGTNCIWVVFEKWVKVLSKFLFAWPLATFADVSTWWAVPTFVFDSRTTEAEISRIPPLFDSLICNCFVHQIVINFSTARNITAWIKPCNIVIEPWRSSKSNLWTRMQRTDLVL